MMPRIVAPNSDSAKSASRSNGGEAALFLLGKLRKSEAFPLGERGKPQVSTEVDAAEVDIGGSELRKASSEVYTTGSAVYTVSSEIHIAGSEVDAGSSERDVVGSEIDTAISEADIAGPEVDTASSERDIVGSEVDEAISEVDRAVSGSITLKKQLPQGKYALAGAEPGS
jgi:hypothetical protein